MIIDNTVTDVVTDEVQHRIPWVKVRHEDGTEKVYVIPEAKLTDDQLAALEDLEMDSRSCHHPHVWKVTGRATCLACRDDEQDHEPGGGDCASCHDVAS